MGEFVNVSVTDSVATVRLDRPPMNAISVQVQGELLFGTEDQKTGMRSFIENGPGKAQFSGR